MRRLRSLAQISLLTLALAALLAPHASAAAPPAAVFLVPTASSAVQIVWTPSQDPVIGYHVYVMDDNRAVFLIGATPAGSTSFLAPGGFLDYGVASVDNNGVSAINWYTTCVSVEPPFPYVWVREGAC